MLIRHLLKRSNKKARVGLKSKRTQRGGGAGFIAQVETPRIGGLAEVVGYSQCCPPVYQNGKLAYTAEGNRMCGGSRKNKSKKGRKLRHKSTKSRKLRKLRKLRKSRK